MADDGRFSVLAGSQFLRSKNMVVQTKNQSYPCQQLCDIHGFITQPRICSLLPIFVPEAEDARNPTFNDLQDAFF